MVRWEVEPSNLMRLVEILSAIAGAPFDGWDEDAIHYGLPGTDAGTGSYYEYGLFGKTTIGLRLACAANRRVAVEASADEATEARMAQIVAWSDAELVGFVQRVFQSAPRPEHFTNSTHCPECEGHDELLRSRTWQTLTHRDVRSTWSPLGFLGPDGFRYWMPALVRLCLAGDEVDVVDQLLRLIAAPDDERLSHLTAAEREAVLRFLRHLGWWRLDVLGDSGSAQRLFVQVLQAWEDGARSQEGFG